MLKHMGKPELPEDVIAGYIGDGASMLVRRALGDPEGDVHDDEYVERRADVFSRLLPRAQAGLHVCVSRRDGVAGGDSGGAPVTLMAVLTNKPVNPSRDICDHFGLSNYFFQNYGGNSFHTKKPDPHGLLTLMAEASAIAGSTITAKETMMVGDTEVDVLTARAIGAISLGCSFGLAPHRLEAARPDFLVDSAKEWMEILGRPGA